MGCLFGRGQTRKALPFKPSTYVHIPSFNFFSRLPLRRLRGYLCFFFSLALDAPSIYPSSYRRTNTGTLTHVVPLSYSPRRLCRIDSVSACPTVISSSEAHSASFVVSGGGRAPCQRTFCPHAQV